jgi:hypothetical protein
VTLEPLIPLAIARELRLPEFGAGGRCTGEAAAVGVPEAAMDLHAASTGRERNVRPTRDLAELDAEAVAKPVKEPTNNKFWLGVRPADARHVRAALFRCQPIRHGGDMGWNYQMFIVLRCPTLSSSAYCASMRPRWDSPATR